jgi:hypothetical protein
LGSARTFLGIGGMGIMGSNGMGRDGMGLNRNGTEEWFITLDWRRTLTVSGCSLARGGGEGWNVMASEWTSFFSL